MANEKPTKPAAPVVAAPKEPQTPAPAANDTVRVYNKSRRQFTHEIYPDNQDGTHHKGNPDGRAPAKFTSLPNAFVTVPKDVAELWLKDFPDDFVANEDALRAVDSSAADLEASKVKAAQLEGEKTQLSAEIEELKKQLAEARGDKK